MLPRRGFRHGVHPAEHKELTHQLPISRMPFPNELVLPLRQHAGNPARDVVNVGDRVERVDTLAEGDWFVSSPIRASASVLPVAIDLVVDEELLKLGPPQKIPRVTKQ